MPRAINDKPIINAKRSITITVNSNDIDKASTKEPADCVVARAFRRETHCKEVRVHLGRVYLRSNEGNWVRYLTPKAMRDEIIAFDRGGRFEPGEFTLAAPQISKKTGKQQGSKKYIKRGKKRRRTPHLVTNVRGGPAS